MLLRDVDQGGHLVPPLDVDHNVLHARKGVVHVLGFHLTDLPKGGGVVGSRDDGGGGREIVQKQGVAAATTAVALSMETLRLSNHTIMYVRIPWFCDQARDKTFPCALETATCILSEQTGVGNRPRWRTDVAVSQIGYHNVLSSNL